MRRVLLMFAAKVRLAANMSNTRKPEQLGLASIGTIWYISNKTKICIVDMQ